MKQVKYNYPVVSGVSSVPMKIGWRDSDDKAIEFMEDNEFTLEVTVDTTTDNVCADAVLKKKTGAHDKSLAFDTTKDWDTQTIYWQNALNVTVEGVNATVCQPFFELFIWDKNEGDYVSSAVMLDTLRNELLDLEYYITSYLEFDPFTADLWASFAKEEIVALGDRFTENGVSAIKFKVKAVLDGVDPDELPIQEFKLIVVDQTQAETCKDNELSTKQVTTYDDTYRGSEVECVIPEEGAAECIIPALAIS
jgi:hypothetical protein